MKKSKTLDLYPFEWIFRLIGRHRLTVSEYPVGNFTRNIFGLYNFFSRPHRLRDIRRKLILGHLAGHSALSTGGGGGIFSSCFWHQAKTFSPNSRRYPQIARSDVFNVFSVWTRLSKERLKLNGFHFLSVSLVPSGLKWSKNVCLYMLRMRIVYICSPFVLLKQTVNRHIIILHS